MPDPALATPLTARRPYTAKIAMDARVYRADGSYIDFGDAIYHPENADEARAYATLDAARQPVAETALREALRTVYGAPDCDHEWSGPLDKHPTCIKCDMAYPPRDLAVPPAITERVHRFETGRNGEDDTLYRAATDRTILVGVINRLNALRAATREPDPAPLDDDLLTVRGALGGLRIEVEDHEWQDEDREFVEHLTRTVERGQNAVARLAHSKDEP